MSDTARLCELLQAHAQLLSIRILAAEGTKEYKADWLKNADTVVRDGSGRFAKKGTSSPETTEVPTPEQPPTVKEKVGQAISDTKKVTSLLLEGGEVSVEMLKKLLTDKDFRRRAGLEVGQTGAQAIKRLAEAAKVNPEFTKKLDSYINKFNQDLIKEYGDDGGAMAQAIRKHGNLPPGKDLKERLELHVAKYRAMEDALESPEVYEKEEPVSVESLAQKVIAASVPIAIGLGITIIPEAIFAGAAFSLTESLIAFAAGEAGVFAADKAMDKLEVDNPVARLGIDLAVGILTSGGITTAFKKGRVSKAKDIANTRVEDVSIDDIKRIAGKDAFVTPLEESYRIAFAKKLVGNMDAAIENLKITSDRLDQVKVNTLTNILIKSKEKTKFKIQNSIARIELERDKLREITEFNELGLRERMEDSISSMSKQFKAIKENPDIYDDPEFRKIFDAEHKKMSNLSELIARRFSLVEKGWRELIPKLEDTYYDAAMLLNKPEFNFATKRMKYENNIPYSYYQEFGEGTKGQVFTVK